MYQVIVPAKNLSKYFNMYELGRNEFSHSSLLYLKSIDEFKYPKHCGTNNDPMCFDEVVLIDNLYIVYDNTKYYINDYDSKLLDFKHWVEDEDIFTFEFETEEEAFYFQLKYSS